MKRLIGWRALAVLAIVLAATFAMGAVALAVEVTDIGSNGSTITVTSMFGQNQIQTAIQVSKAGFPNNGHPADAVVLATAYTWPDALSAASMAGILDAPILLVGHDIAPASELAVEINRLHAGADKAGREFMIYIVGGPVAVPKPVEDWCVGAMGSAANVKRVWGPTLYDTSQAILSEDITLRGGPEHNFWNVFVCTGKLFPDALSASPMSYATNWHHANGDGPGKDVWPIILAENGSFSGGLSQRVFTQLQAATKNHFVNVVVVGGTSVVSAAAAEAIRTSLTTGSKVYRWWGDDAYATAVSVAEHSVNGFDYDDFADDPTYDGWFNADDSGLANGQVFADALVASSYQGMAFAPLLTTPSSNLNHSAQVWFQKYGQHGTEDIDSVNIYGGKVVIPQMVRDELIWSLTH